MFAFNSAWTFHGVTMPKSHTKLSLASINSQRAASTQWSTILLLLLFLMCLRPITSSPLCSSFLRWQTDLEYRVIKFMTLLRDEGAWVQPSPAVVLHGCYPLLSVLALFCFCHICFHYHHIYFAIVIIISFRTRTYCRCWFCISCLCIYLYIYKYE